MRLESAFLRRRPLFWIALACCVGIFLDAALALPFTPILFGCSAIFAAAIALAFFQKKIIFAVALTIALALGTVTHAARFRISPPDDIGDLTPPRQNYTWIRGTILEAALRDGTRAAWIIAVDSLGRDAKTWLPASGKIRVTAQAKAHPDGAGETDDAAEIRVENCAEGDRIELRALLEPLPPLTLPDTFDYGAYLAGIGIRRMGSLSSGTLASHRRSGLVACEFDFAALERNLGRENAHAAERTRRPSRLAQRHVLRTP